MSPPEFRVLLALLCCYLISPPSFCDELLAFWIPDVNLTLQHTPLYTHTHGAAVDTDHSLSAGAALLRRLDARRLHVDHLVRRLGGGLGTLHPGQGLCYPLEQGLDVVPQLGARLHEHEVVLLRLLLALLRRHLALVVQVRLVAHQDDNNVVAALGPHVVDPFPRVLEALSICMGGSGQSVSKCLRRSYGGTSSRSRCQIAST